MFLAPLATASAPWWGASVIAALAALGGVLLTLLGTHRRTSLELKRADRARWDNQMLDTATTLVALSGELAESGKVGRPSRRHRAPRLTVPIGHPAQSRSHWKAPSHG